MDACNSSSACSLSSCLCSWQLAYTVNFVCCAGAFVYSIFFVPESLVEERRIRLELRYVKAEQGGVAVVFGGMTPGGGVGTRPRYSVVCLWRRLLASRHCSF